MPSTNHNQMNAHRTPFFFHRLAAGSVVLGVLALTGCHGQDAAHGSADVVDKRSQQLADGELKSINGTYGAGCDERAGSWSLEAQIGAPLDHPEVSVLLNDADCVLTMTEMVTETKTLLATPDIALALTFPMDPSEFAEDGQPLELYGKASIDTNTFASDFVISIIYSDDPSLLTDSNTADWEVVTSSVSDSAVASPDYTIDVSGLSLLTDVDDVVVSAAGDAVLTPGLVAGDFYVVVDASGLATFEDIDAAYVGGTPAAFTTNIPAAAFQLVGDDLSTPQKRTLIVANIEDDVPAYQSFEITFNPAV